MAARTRWRICSVASPTDGAEIIEALRRDFKDIGRSAELSADAKDRSRWNITIASDGPTAQFVTGWIVGYLRHAQLIEKMHPVELAELLELLQSDYEARAALAADRAARRGELAQDEQLEQQSEHERAQDEQIQVLEGELEELRARRPRRPRRQEPLLGASPGDPPMRPRSMRERLLAPTQQEVPQLEDKRFPPPFSEGIDDDDDGG